MFIDITGKRRLKACPHLHTTCSDGKITPEEAMELYEKAGYDILAITDHWRFSAPGQYGRMKLISGCEYHAVGNNGTDNLMQTFHILGLDAHYPCDFPKAFPYASTPISERVMALVESIRSAGGAAILAHPAWSLNAPDQIMACGDFDGTEIYNSVSEHGMSDRPYSGQVVDMLAMRGVNLPLLATDDAHYYDGDQMRGITMLEADAVEELGVAGAIKAGRFYSTQGPEIHLEQVSEKRFRVRCTPVSKIVFLSNLPWAPNRVQKGDGLTEAYFDLDPRGYETFLRAEVTDRDGRCGWSNIIML
jgi:histidinol phosphatase-like PHP family hydrolase